MKDLFSRTPTFDSNFVSNKEVIPIGKSKAGSQQKTTPTDFETFEFDDNPLKAFFETIDISLLLTLPRYQTTDIPQALLNRFAWVDPTFCRHGAPRLQNFLMAALDEMKVNVSQYHLMCDTNAHCSTGILEGRIPFLNLYDCWMATTDDIRFMVLHELRHIQQVERGWLQFGEKKSSWMGCAVEGNADTIGHYNYCRLPQELDASCFAISHPMVDRHNCHLYSETVQAANQNIHRWNESSGLTD